MSKYIYTKLTMDYQFISSKYLKKKNHTIFFKYKQQYNNCYCEKFLPIFNSYDEITYYITISNGIMKDNRMMSYPILIGIEELFTNYDDWYKYIIPYLISMKNNYAEYSNDEDIINFINQNKK